MALTVLAAVAGALRYLRITLPNWRREVAFAATAVTGAGLALLHATILDAPYLYAGRCDPF